MALVRVYCGLALADPAGRSAAAESTLVTAVVDDAGRLLNVREISDEPAGYAQLCALLVQRSGGPSGAAIAADSDDHTVTSLFSAAGRPLAIADDDLVDDFAERFADDESAEERQSPPAVRRAVGLARALQAGALSALTLPAPRDLAGYQPVLAAHAALANGRHAAAVALREVLRELYPAALRAYPDPAEPVSLAVLDALPEPGMLVGPGNRGRDTSVATDAIAAHLVADGVADETTISDAVTSLRVAIAETPSRAAGNKALTSAVAETVRQAVAAVRAFDAGCEALVATLIARATASPVANSRRRTVRRAAEEPVTQLANPVLTPPEPVPTIGRRGRPTPIAPPPVAPSPVAPPPVAPTPVAPPPVAPAAAFNTSETPVLAAHGDAERKTAPVSAPPAEQPGAGRPAARRPDSPANRPISAPPPPPPGITPISPAPRLVPPAEAGEPFRATLTQAALNDARNEHRQRLTPIAPANSNSGQSNGVNGFGPADLSVPVPMPRPTSESAPPGTRANWPLVNSAEDRADSSAGAGSPYRRAGGPTGATPALNQGDSANDRPSSYDDRTNPINPVLPYPLGNRNADPGPGDGRVTPPWLADDLPPEPPTLRLVESPTSAPEPLERASRESFDAPAEARLDGPSLRLVGSDSPIPDSNPGPSRDSLPSRSARRTEPSAPPVSDEGDGDLLIFGAVRSAWFTDHPEESDTSWSSTADSGWRAAEQAAQPQVGAETGAGLPKRVPQANLVPGSPLRDERPLRIVRDAARIAEHTTGYFRGWRRGQEIGGFAVGGRPGRETAGWDFTRDTDERDDNRDFEYRPAGRRS